MKNVWKHIYSTQSVPHVRFWGCRQAREGSASSYTGQVLVTPTTVCLPLSATLMAPDLSPRMEVCKPPLLLLEASLIPEGRCWTEVCWFSPVIPSSGTPDRTSPGPTGCPTDLWGSACPAAYLSHQLYASSFNIPRPSHRLFPLPWALLLQLLSCAFFTLLQLHLVRWAFHDHHVLEGSRLSHSLPLFLPVFLSATSPSLCSPWEQWPVAFPPVFQDLGQHQALGRGSVSTCERPGSLPHTERVSLGTWGWGNNQAPSSPASAEHWLNTRPLTYSISSVSVTPFKVGKLLFITC